jgi:hypothetical protein
VRFVWLAPIVRLGPGGGRKSRVPPFSSRPGSGQSSAIFGAVVRTAASGPYLGNVVNPDTGRPVPSGEDQLRRGDFRKAKHSEVVIPEAIRDLRAFFSPLWQADNKKIQRMAPIEFIGRYLDGFFDYGMGFQEHLPENVRLEGMTDWRTVPSVVKTAA